jgi:hypothetical protein
VGVGPAVPIEAAEVIVPSNAWKGAVMRAITFPCEETLRMPPGEIPRQILNLARWPESRGSAGCRAIGQWRSSPPESLYIFQARPILTPV